MEEQTLNTIIKRRVNGAGLFDTIISLGLPVQETYIDLRDNHRSVLDEAKAKAIQNQSVKG